jgi:hypothetical protein
VVTPVGTVTPVGARSVSSIHALPVSVPRVLAAPPWRGRLSTPALAPRAPSGPTAAAHLVWLDGEREAALDAPAARLSVAASEARLDELLDRLDEGGTITRSEMERLTDPHLAELAKSLPAKSLDARTARWLLARLEGAFLARVIAWVRARAHETTLFSVLLPVRASDLAPLAAELAAAEPVDATDESAPEQWLVRHAEAALAGLGAASTLPPGATSAMIYVALRAGVAVPGLEALAPIVPFARRDAALARAIARGRDDLAFARLDDPRVAPWIARALDGPLHVSALRWLEARAEAARPVLAAEGTDAARRALVMLDTLDPALFDLPRELPSLPPFFDAARLPPPRLIDGDQPLDTESMIALGEMLALSSLDRPYRGVGHVKHACTAESLDVLVASVFDAWSEAGEPHDAAPWVLAACARLGGDRAAGRVAARLRSWASAAIAPRWEWDDNGRHREEIEGDRLHELVQAGLAAIGEMRSALAIAALADLAAHGKQAWLRRAATEIHERVAQSPTADPDDAELPTFGLDARGSMVLDFGPRKFGVAWDEALVPHVIDGTGARLRQVPRIRQGDDPIKAVEALARFAALRENTGLLARQQLGALERAMMSGRSWTRPLFASRFLAHPILQQVARRLVWALHEGRSPPRSFRIAEDLSFADEHDASLVIEEGARVRVLHPVEVPPAVRARWRAIFDDYRIVQPFPQIDREVFAVDDAIAGETEIAALAGMRTSRGLLLGLARRGWTGRTVDGLIAEWERVLPIGGATIRFTVTPGILFGDRSDDAEQTVSEVRCSATLGSLPPVDFSEAMRTLEALRRS